MRSSNWKRALEALIVCAEVEVDAMALERDRQGGDRTRWSGRVTSWCAKKRLALEDDGLRRVPPACRFEIGL